MQSQQGRAGPDQGDHAVEYQCMLCPTTAKNLDVHLKIIHKKNKTQIRELKEVGTVLQLKRGDAAPVLVFNVGGNTRDVGGKIAMLAGKSRCRRENRDVGRKILIS